jgi:GNAT superfamily N-acetyltransferase
MAVIDAPVSEILSLAHVESALALSIEAGWNQTPDDWAFFTEHGRTRGIFVDGELIATAATLTYGSRLGYVCMILVTPRFRNRGIAMKLLRESVDDLEVRGYRALLDATPAGAVVYRRLGFVDVFPLRRWQGEGYTASGAALRTATLPNVEHLIVRDAVAFGADRPFLIRNLLARAGTHALVSDGGFVVRRKGNRADQIGPLVAADGPGAQQLVFAAIGLGAGPVFLDVPDHQQSLGDFLEALGFSVQRPFTRMGRGLSTRPGDPARLFVAAGPEFG